MKDLLIKISYKNDHSKGPVIVTFSSFKQLIVYVRNHSISRFTLQCIKGIDFTIELASLPSRFDCYCNSLTDLQIISILSVTTHGCLNDLIPVAVFKNAHAYAVLSGFSWAKTIEGYSYWSKVHSSLGGK